MAALIALALLAATVDGQLSAFAPPAAEAPAPEAAAAGLALGISPACMSAAVGGPGGEEEGGGAGRAPVPQHAAPCNLGGSQLPARPRLSRRLPRCRAADL